MDILWLGEADCGNRALVGGNVAHLSRLAAAYPVPPGFCVPMRALAKASPSVMLPPLRQRITDAYQRLTAESSEAEPRVVVRPSAMDEVDSAIVGPHETFSNITGSDAVLDAVAHCLAAHTERAYEYRRQHGWSLDRIGLAVLVQRLIPADVSAVVCSANPMTGNRNEIVINASWGLGASIAGGTVTPDTSIVHRTSGAIIEQRIAEKQRMTVAIPGGTREIDVPHFIRMTATLKGRQVAAMANLARSLEQTMGWPVTIECALHQNRLFLLQCRPITPRIIERPSPALIAQGARAAYAIAGA